MTIHRAIKEESKVDDLFFRKNCFCSFRLSIIITVKENIQNVKFVQH